jgi:hypothetical protein
VYIFENSNLINSYQNAPNLTNLKNDYSIWGTKKNINGNDLNIHLRYAIDAKPKYYKSITVTQNDIDLYTPLHREITNMKP